MSCLCRCCHLRDPTWCVHQLNNRGCVSIINGNYLSGINLFELAIHICKSSSMASPCSASQTTSSFLYSCNCERTGILEVVDIDDSGQNSVHNLHDFCEHSVESDTDDFDGDDFRIQRITTTSRLRNVSFPGQQQEEPQQQGNQKKKEKQTLLNHRLYHQVYRLPIVMDNEEWETASIKDKTFVLVFNAALCNHLLGMELLVEEKTGGRGMKSQHESTIRQQLLQNHPCKSYFSVARALYRLAIDSLFSFMSGIDKINCMAVFNNFSHVCKTLEGYDSKEAFWSDQQLLKSIYWWKYSQQPATTLYSATHVQSRPTAYYTGGSASHPTAPAGMLHTSSGSASTSGAVINDRYDEEDLEIVDIFLENVFYLISTRGGSVTAPMA